MPTLRNTLSSYHQCCFIKGQRSKSHIQGLYWFRRGLWSWGSHPQTPGLRTNREPKYKRRRTVRVSSLIAARQPWCTHTLGIWRRPCEKPYQVSFALVDVWWSYWDHKPVGGRIIEGMLKQRLWWEMPQWIGFRTRVQFPPGPLNCSKLNTYTIIIYKNVGILVMQWLT